MPLCNKEEQKEEKKERKKEKLNKYQVREGERQRLTHLVSGVFPVNSNLQSLKELQNKQF